MKVFITRVIPETGRKLLLDAGLTLTEWKEKRNLTTSELIAQCQQHDALLSVSTTIGAEVFLACSNLKAIALMSVGFDHVDLDAATQAGIPVSNTPGVLSGATADAAFLLMLATSRKAFFQHKKIAKGNWNFFEPTADLGIELNGATLGVFGLGNIGVEMARKCVGAYGMHVIYHNRNRNWEAEQKLNAKYVSFEELLEQSDVLSVHTALTPETKGKFDREAFSKMKDNAIFVNTARGGIHNENDLLEALQEGLIWGAGLDVTNPEPMDANNPLLDLPNVSVLPHIGSATVETRNAMAQLAAKNIIAGLHGKQLPNIINPQVYS
ncbi:MAG: D-glycerate dehydrogenase [Pedobacter sp.]|nr:MAG: D-glycerate dehydrogenase [Pedobacter sp.]